MKWSSLSIVLPLKLFKCALPSSIELLNKLFSILRIWLSSRYIFLFTMVRSGDIWSNTRNSSYRIFTLCVDLIGCYCFGWTNPMWIIFSALDLDFVFVISQRLWWLVGIRSCNSWILIWLTSLTIRLSNRFCEFTGEGFFGDTELEDAVFVLFKNLVFIVFHSLANLSFVISVSITACRFLI